MARPRKQTYPLETYLNYNKEGDISNNADTQRKPAWKAIINGLSRFVCVYLCIYMYSNIINKGDHEFEKLCKTRKG